MRVQGPYKSNEVPVETYVRTLPIEEREGLMILFDVLHHRLMRTYNLLGLAVGTTTYSGEYWLGLENYLRKSDPSKLDYVKRRGEDIDLILCPDNSLSGYSKSFLLPSFYELTKKNLLEKGVDFQEDGEGRDSGTLYMTVPQEYQEQEGQGVIRHKKVEYGSEGFRISLPKCRPIHLSFGSWPGDIKLAYERKENMPFSLLFRNSATWEFDKVVKSVNSQLELDLFGEWKYLQED